MTPAAHVHTDASVPGLPCTRPSAKRLTGVTSQNILPSQEDVNLPPQPGHKLPVQMHLCPERTMPRLGCPTSPHPCQLLSPTPVTMSPTGGHPRAGIKPKPDCPLLLTGAPQDRGQSLKSPALACHCPPHRAKAQETTEAGVCSSTVPGPGGGPCVRVCVCVCVCVCLSVGGRGQGAKHS